MLFLRGKRKTTYTLNVEGVHVIKFTIWSIARNEVEIAFDAPPEVTIRRDHPVPAATAKARHGC